MKGFVVHFYNIQSKQLLNYEILQFLVVVLLTALAFCRCCDSSFASYFPRSYNEQKFEAYECGIPTRGKSWMQFRVGYYLFAILFLMFEVETVFPVPLGSHYKGAWSSRAFQYLFFLIILILGSCLCLEERSFGMEVTKETQHKNLSPYEEFTDNETLEKLVRELNAGGANVALGVLDDFVNLGDAVTHCGRLRLQQVVAVSNLWPSVQPAMIWHASGLK